MGDRSIAEENLQEEQAQGRQRREKAFPPNDSQGTKQLHDGLVGEKIDTARASHAGQSRTCIRHPWPPVAR
jgi:hypothetical protein